jgi:hypothetical protein
MTNFDIYYWECFDENNKNFHIVEKNSISRYNDILNNLSKKAKQTYGKEDREKAWEVFFTVKDFFVDVKHSFASTIHKLQGSTYETIYIDLYTISKNNMDRDTIFRLIYVAITRASKNIKILIPPFQDKLSIFDIKLDEI